MWAHNWGHKDLKICSSKVFMVWDGNHCLQALLPIINLDHTHDSTWHYVVENIILDIERDIAIIMATLHEINW